MVRVYDTDTAYEIAKKIYELLDVGVSVSITGFVTIEKNMRILPKGQAVIDQIRAFDEIDHVREKVTSRGLKKQRDYTYPKDSIGGPTAQKQFRFDIKTRNSEPFITIWRTQ